VLVTWAHRGIDTEGSNKDMITAIVVFLVFPIFGNSLLIPENLELNFAN
jgi:hypothetical protein